MATQEPNVYAGLSVVVGGLMHARPRFFAKVMGELLFWVGEDKMLFGSDYAIWEPKWQVEGLVDWDYPDDDVLGLPALDDRGEEEGARPQRRASCTAIEVPEEFRLPGEGRPAARTTRSWWRARRDRAGAGARGARHRLRPRARRADHLPRLRRLVRRVRTAATSTCTCACRPRSARRTSRSSWSPTRATPCVACRGCGEVARRARRPLHRRRDQRRGRARRRLRRRRSPARPRRRPRRAARAVPAQGAARPPGPRLREALLADGARRRREVVALRVADLPATTPRPQRCLALRRELGLPARRRRARARRRRRRRAGRRRTCRPWLRRARLVGLSLESNGGLCRSLLRVRHGVPDPTEEVAA